MITVLIVNYPLNRLWGRIKVMKKILITGSTGYIGSRLISALSETDYSLNCTARNPKYLESRLPSNATAYQVDFINPNFNQEAFKDCDTAFFLLHALGETKEFEDIEKKMAENFVNAAKQNRVKHIIYLGGLFNEDHSKHSPHMRSRKKVGDTLRASKIPVTEFRASVILGSGSTSFELIRALVERLPMMVTPKWVHVKAQPIYSQDVITYLTQAILKQPSQAQIVEIGGKNKVTYKDIMDLYAKTRGLKRFMIPVPFLTPKLSSLWLGLVTPLYARVGKKLIDSITEESVVLYPKAATQYDISPLSCEEAIIQCLKDEDQNNAQINWAQALSSSIKSVTHESSRYHNRIIDHYSITIPKNIKNPFQPVAEIGGKNGWYYLNFLWVIRGALDLLVGGIGLRRGRPHPTKLTPGDTLDWWRVTAYTPQKHLKLKAEMRLPGRAWLEFNLITGNGKRELKQTVIYDPKGLFGLLYWYALLPIHGILFKGMLKRMIEISK